MDRYQTLFQRLADKNQGAFVPFVTIGDPNPELSLQIMQTLVDAGADALELGMPFSDPQADGPTIQGANIRALEANTTPDICFDLIRKIREQHPDLPIGLLMYANLVYSRGIDNFYQRCQSAGVDSVLIADVPTNESRDFVAAAEKYGIHPIFIAPPTASDETLESVAKLSGGYTYLLSRSGVTGTETKANMPVHALLDRLNQFDAPPALLGFGISEPAQVKQAIEAGAAGAISGSAVVKIIEQNIVQPHEMLTGLSKFVSSMKAATIR
ncbi:tryptophan synthase subunit alpha [Vibrio aestuarianus]|uniref:Tryptophan synthase alpha chain n=1 Tax=Vibrio aestuarianus TaxID=28171 RepID=A0ABN8TQH0_9VIBR|nr:tryptophan synthase subunit alpha [Vibrio aestuarianus]MDE1213208.1 tryptophan synthase subunit alpha [Vibrio aestuarianus]MDE1216592.1 tryptophan synthase subunit alpha [Vibrio aestuarianus]MDE1227862.1 tryptophan synthase subunit alpha [Vibrio aestuarianus]MDE1256334.1 tryptophan synthase subunit alpha [Vibrio aestuarianus]MDE1267059.1 tryptophan synthase subunit alpha [Vibrio aestuarianus]